MTRIDVMIPAYNAEATIGPAIESVRRGQHEAVTIVVVDDGSTDGTGALVQALAAEDSRIRYVRQENRGIAGARQRALEETTSAFVSQLDADDLSDPDRLPRLLAVMERRPDCVAVCGAARHIDGDGRPTGHVVRLGDPGAADPDWLPAREPAQLPFALWRRDALMAAGGYRPFVYGEDVDLSWRLLEIGAVENLDAVVGSYRFHASSTGSSLVNTRILAVETQLAALSARRRRAGRPDIALTRERRADYRAAESLAGICAIAATGLDPQEARALRRAASFKMLAWLEDRRQLPDDGDCAFIRASLDALPSLCAPNRAEIRRTLSVVAARLIAAGALARAARLAPPALMPAALARTALRRH
ncbi:glycosyltransferase family 2 protein [Methylobacterium sp. JK268]